MGPKMLVVALALALIPAADAARRNVLHMVADDLRTELSLAYNHPEVSTPNLDALTKKSLVFQNAYCQQPICSPSRNSFMSGLTPDHTQVWNFIQYFRQARPDAVSFPQYFKNAGYLSLGAGKLYHTSNPPNHDVPQSWSPERTADLVGLGPQCPAQQSETTNVSCDMSISGEQACYYEPEWQHCTRPASTFCVNDTSAKGEDGSTAALTKIHLARAKAEGRNFYIGCGFHRPHAAYITTSKHWATYDGANISAAKHRTMHASVPDIAMIVNFGIGLTNGSHYTWDPRNQPVPVEVQLEVRRHYYAAISWMDELVGEVLDSLDDHGFTGSTIVIFHSDHGYFMGESGEWEKKMLFENTARVPLLIHDPSYPHQMRTTELAELTDMYPTVVSLAGLPSAGSSVDGKDLSALFAAGGTVSPPLKPAAFSQFPRCPDEFPVTHHICFNTNDTAFPFMGYSIRVGLWRYTEWRRWDGSHLVADWTADGLSDQELYDHSANHGWPADSPGSFDYEQVNLAVGTTKAAHARTIAKLAAQLQAHYAVQDQYV